MGWEISKLWGCRNCCTSEMQRMERNLLQLFNRAPRALWPFCRYLEGSHLMSKKLVKSRWRMRLQIYCSIALRYRKGNSALSRGCTQGLFIKHIHQRCQLSNTLALGPQVHYKDLPKQASFSISVRTWLSNVESHGLSRQRHWNCHKSPSFPKTAGHCCSSTTAANSPLLGAAFRGDQISQNPKMPWLRFGYDSASLSPRP